MHKLAHPFQSLLIILHQYIAEHYVIERLVNIQTTQADIRKVCLIACTWYCVPAIVRFILWFLLCLYGCLKVYYCLLVVSHIEVHHPSVKVEVFWSKDVLFVIAERLNQTWLGLKLVVSWILDIKCILDLPLLLLLPVPKGLILYPFPSKCPYLLNLYPLHIRDYLLMLSDCTNGGMKVTLYFQLCTK